MSFKFDYKARLALAFSAGDSTLVGFEFYGIREEGPDDIIKCDDKEAEAWGVYARLQEADGKLTLPHWIADVDQQAAAKALCDILNNIHEELTTPKSHGEFIHPDIQAGLRSLDDGQSYNFTIKQSCNFPKHFELYIWEADADQTYFYTSKADAENDVRMAAKYYNLELIDFSALPSIG